MYDLFQFDARFIDSIKKKTKRYSFYRMREMYTNIIKHLIQISK